MILEHNDKLAGPLLPVLSSPTTVAQNSILVISTTVMLVALVMLVVLSPEKLMIVTSYSTAQSLILQLISSVVVCILMCVRMIEITLGAEGGPTVIILTLSIHVNSNLVHSFFKSQ